MASLLAFSILRSVWRWSELGFYTLVLNSSCPRYGDLKAALDAGYHDDVGNIDAIVSEVKSRDFLHRVAQENVSAAYLGADLSRFAYDARSTIDPTYYPTLCSRSCTNYTMLPIELSTAGAAAAFSSHPSLQKAPSLGVS